MPNIFNDVVSRTQKERNAGMLIKKKDDFFKWNQDLADQLPDLYPLFHSGCIIANLAIYSIFTALELAEDPKYSRYDRLLNMAQAYADAYVHINEEMKAFIEKGEHQVEQYNLQIFKQELNKIKDYYNYWYETTQKWKNGLLDRLVENFNDEEIEETLEPMLFDKFKRRFFQRKHGDYCAFSVVYNLGDTERTQNVLDANMQSFRNGRKLARQAWAKRLGISYEEANQLAATEPENNEPTKVSYLLATYGTHEEYEADLAKRFQIDGSKESNQDSNKESIDKFINNNCETELPMDFEAQESLNSHSCEPSQLSDSDSVTSELDDENRVTKANPGLPKLGLFANSQDKEEPDSYVDDRQFDEPATPV